ncbi:MAG: hypothetical protein MZU84_08305 [Sphingobacterium sp.]|nr:hypothetical protein [Sphingobacterium sp.]
MPDPELIRRPPWITLDPIKAAAMEYREFDYDSLVRPLEPRMMRTVWRIVRHEEAAEDALQDALAVIWKKRDAVARHPNPRALILKIAVAAALRRRPEEPAAAQPRGHRPAGRSGRRRRAHP